MTKQGPQLTKEILRSSSRICLASVSATVLFFFQRAPIILAVSARYLFTSCRMQYK